jgi:small conductance mechanosensitive channel
MIFDINFEELFVSWVFDHGIRILAIAVLAYMAQRFAHGFIERFIKKVIPQGRGSKMAEEKRENTLIGVTSGTFTIVIFIVAGLMMLSEFGVAVGPLLAAAGIVGIAVGFGGQYLIRDIITGLFILMENQYRVGDVIKIDSISGLVESVSLRMTTLRDMDGTVHHIPHGEVKSVSNLSKEFARVNLNIGISYNANLEEVISVVNQVGMELFEDSDWKEKIISAPQFLRVEDFGDSAVLIKIVGDTTPLEQWGVTGELRKRLKIAFDAQGIEIPFPQRVVHTI